MGKKSGRNRNPDERKQKSLPRETRTPTHKDEGKENAN